MAYKKYIKKGGRIYGPYIYHSHRVDGKVVSEYRGASRNFEYKKFLFILFGLFLLVSLILGLVVFNKGISGRAVLNLEGEYKAGEPLQGDLKLSLKEGELIPASSKLIIESEENVYEYNLNELVSDETTEGNFYVEGKSLSGNGAGYGKEGTTETFPVVYFSLEIYNSQESVAEQTETETPPLPPSPEQNEISTTSPEQGEAEISQTTTGQTEISTTTPEQTETSAISTEQSSATEEPETNQLTPITGGVISNFFRKLRMTGNVVLELQTEIQGEVSADSPSVYDIAEGQSAELKPRSVKTEYQELSDNAITIETENNKVFASTSYSERKSGFGEEYLGSNIQTLVIPLSTLNLVPGKEMKISIIYEGEEIISVNADLEKEETEEPAEEQKINLTENQTQINLTSEENATAFEPSNISLTDEEKQILLENLGNIPVTTIRSEVFNGKLIRGYEYGGYKIEYSYDYPQNETVLEEKIKEDIIRWQKEIAEIFLSKKIVPEQVEIGEAEY